MIPAGGASPIQFGSFQAIGETEPMPCIDPLISCPVLSLPSPTLRIVAIRQQSFLVGLSGSVELNGSNGHSAQCRASTTIAAGESNDRDLERLDRNGVGNENGQRALGRDGCGQVDKDRALLKVPYAKRSARVDKA